MKRQSKWGQNKLRPGAAGQRQGGGGGRRAALPGRSGLAAALRRHFISVTCTGAWAASCSLDGTSHADLGQVHALPVCVSFLLRQGDGGRNTCRGASTLGDTTLRASCLVACTWVAWALRSTMSAVHSDSLILSRCQESPRQPASARGGRHKPGSPSTQRPHCTPCSGGRRTEGTGKL